MKKSVFSSLVVGVLLFACHTTEKSVQEPDAGTKAMGEGIGFKDSIAPVELETDSARAIKHSGPNQEETDSLKKVKLEKKKQGK